MSRRSCIVSQRQRAVRNACKVTTVNKRGNPIANIASAESRETVEVRYTQALQAFTLPELPQPLCFDHGQILQDYLHYRYYGKRPNLG